MSTFWPFFFFFFTFFHFYCKLRQAGRNPHRIFHIVQNVFFLFLLFFDFEPFVFTVLSWRSKQAVRRRRWLLRPARSLVPGMFANEGCKFTLSAPCLAQGLIIKIVKNFCGNLLTFKILYIFIFLQNEKKKTPDQIDLKLASSFIQCRYILWLN